MELRDVRTMHLFPVAARVKYRPQNEDAELGSRVMPSCAVVHLFSFFCSSVLSGTHKLSVALRTVCELCAL